MEVREPDARYLKPFQRSDLGELPADWNVVQLGTFEPFITSGSRGWATFYADLGSIFLRITNLSRSCIYPSLKDLRYVEVPPENSEGVRTALMVDDVLISITADIGIVGLVTDSVDLPAYINQHIALVRFAEDTVNSRYIAYFLAGASAQRRFKSMTDAGAKAGMNLAGVRGLLVAIPPTTDEQAAIAQALSDVDALIAGLEKLIDKKRDLKQAAMQQLLTGQTRLPGFSGEWEVKRLGDVGVCLRGVSYKGDADLFPHDTDTSKRLLRSNNVQESLVVTSDLQYVKADRVREHQILRDGDVLICMANGSKALVGKAGYFDISDEFEYTFGAFMGAYRGNEQANCRFVFYLFQTDRYRDYITNLLAGSSINNLSPSSIESLEFNFPELAEQNAIAQALSDMDGELGSLESRLAKTHTIKQGMMQELLTGRTRLV